MPTLVNGISYNYASISINVLGIESTAWSSISYSVSTDTKQFYGNSRQPVALGYGNNTYDCSLESYLDLIQQFREAAKNAGLSSITDIAPFDIVITYGQLGQVKTTHILEKCVFLNDDTSGAAGDAQIKTSMKLLPANIIY